MRLANFLHDLSTATAIFDLDYNCFSTGQLKSKEWLVETFKDIKLQENLKFGTVYVLCGWYGILPAMLFLEFGLDNGIDKIRSFDIDDKCEKIADQINKTYSSNNWTFKAVVQDINEINFVEHQWQCWSNKNNRMSYPIKDVPTTVINTSCEHTSDEWYNNVPPGRIIALQSNDSFDEEGHINAVSSLDEFKEKYPMKHVYYTGSMEFEKYTRFMIIGKK